MDVDKAQEVTAQAITATPVTLAYGSVLLTNSGGYLPAERELK